MAWLARRAISVLSVFAKMNVTSADFQQLFLPPVNRTMRTLDRAFFRKSVPLSAITVSDNRDISQVRNVLENSGDVIFLPTVHPIQKDEMAPGKKCILLRPGISPTDQSSWSPSLLKLVEEKKGILRHYELILTYDDWPMQTILEAVLPEFPDSEKETPAGFAQVGHVAHVNLREQYVPFKHLVGQIIVDKNAAIRTVINKTEDVGTESIFRTFPYEVLAGDDDMDVTVSESGCEFRFNFGKVYWNSRLGTEHARLVSMFKEGEAVCDVMAGVGPFAVPAGKRNVFVTANDLNPDSFIALNAAIERNKVGGFVVAYCQDGRDFIRTATRNLPTRRRETKVKPPTKISRKAAIEEKKIHDKQTRTLQEPPTFDHYVMNLPKTAVEFLDAFRGVHATTAHFFEPKTTKKLPMIHVYLFTTRKDTEEEEAEDICKTISQHLGHTVTPGTPEMELWYVRLVSPKKKMYCASFRLPPEVGFAKD